MEINLNTILSGVILACVGAVLTSIRSALRTLNALELRMAHLEEWRIAQENLCRGRLEHCDELRRVLNKSLDELCAQVRQALQ